LRKQQKIKVKDTCKNQFENKKSSNFLTAWRKLIKEYNKRKMKGANKKDE